MFTKIIRTMYSIVALETIQYVMVIFKSQWNYRKTLSSPLVMKSNLKILNIFGREILNSRSARKKLSKTHRPKTGVAAG